jgi:hypothetical protein
MSKPIHIKPCETEHGLAERARSKKRAYTRSDRKNERLQHDTSEPSAKPWERKDEENPS